MPSARKPYVTAPETHDEESAVAEGPEVNPWLWILIRPRATIRQIVDVDPQLHVMLLSCAYGINAVVGLNDGMPWRTGIGNMRYVVLLPLALVAGPLLGIVSVSVISWCSRVAAGWVDGVASEHETQAALAWSMVAEIYTFPLTLATALATSPDVGLGLSPSAEGLIQLNLVVSLAARLWSLVLFVNALAEVNRFSRQRALLSMIAGFCIFAGAIVLLVLLIAAINLVLR